MSQFTTSMLLILMAYCIVMYIIGCSIIISGDRRVLNLSWKGVLTYVLAPISLPYLAIRNPDD